MKVLAVSPPNLLPTPSLLAVGAEWERIEGLDVVQAPFSSSQNICVLSTPF